MVQCMGSEYWGFNLLHINGPMYGAWVQGIQPSTYEWSNVWGLSAGIQPSTYEWSLRTGDSTFYILMVQCMGSECWGSNLLHINGPMYGVWVLGIQAFIYSWFNVWGLSAGDSTFYILMVQCMGSESSGFNLLHINDPIYGVWVLGIQPSTYEWSNLWGLSAVDSSLYILMVQCMGSDCWGSNLLHMNGPMYGVWLLGIQAFTY